MVNISIHTIDELLNFNNLSLLKYKEYYKWNQNDIKSYINVIINNKTNDSTFVILQDKYCKKIIDGNNRISSIIKFYNNHFSLSDNCNIQQIKGCFYESLNQAYKTQFLNYQIPCEYIDKDYYKYLYVNIFENHRILKYKGSLISEAKSLSNIISIKLRNSLFTNDDIRNLLDIYLIIKILMLIELNKKDPTYLDIYNYVCDRDLNWDDKDYCVNFFHKIFNDNITSITSKHDLYNVFLNNKQNYND